MDLAIYAGTFDPVTNGHLDILRRATLVFPRIVVATAETLTKSCTFPLEERLALLRQVTAKMPGIEVRPFRGLLIEFAKSIGAKAIIRGLRQTTDFDYEFQIATMNTRFDSTIQTVFFVASLEYLHLSSSLVKEIATLGGDVSHLVPSVVEDAIIQKLGSLGDGKHNGR
ncbi:MAG: pantetheine-phosphate adenylyltransferase [Candidatus Riflebacteria bacterium RBG_13_59_9]|nr:MAG: pantetheine-phosphate adenylyltransferase [Candidatus Riflebacteria bacterium RBG_13_59_9]